ncbi:MAG: tetratricopeptide repeat protein [Bryobacteraceae bacterium]
MRLLFQTLLVLAPLCSIAAVTARAQDEALAAKSHAAKDALIAGHYTQAAKLYRELAAALPGNPGPRLSLALALEKAGHPAEAIPELDRVVHAEPRMAPAWFLLGLAYQQLGQPQKAIAPLQNAVRLDSTNLQAQIELADAEMGAGDARDAVEGFQSLAARHPEMAKAWQGLGFAYATLGERASKRLDEAAPHSSFWDALMARARFAEGRYAEALALDREAIRQSPELAGLHAARAEIYRAAKHPDWAAVEDARESNVRKPDCPASAAACAYLSGDWAAALAAAGKTISPENLYWAALACAKLAEGAFQHVAALPSTPEIHELMAESDQRLGRRVEAVAEWRKALAIAPHDRRLQGRLAESLDRDHQYEEAGQLLKPLVAAQPENGEWQYLMGEVLYRERRAELALPYLVAAQRLQPEHLEAMEILGRVYLELDQPAKAIACLEKARPLDDGSISFALNTAYRRLGREEEARAALARYRRLTPGVQSAPSTTGGSVIPPP